MNLTKRQQHILMHSIGFDPDDRKQVPYRNNYAANPQSDAVLDCMRLATMGLMVRGRVEPQMFYYSVTVEGVLQAMGQRATREEAEHFVSTGDWPKRAKPKSKAKQDCEVLR